MRYTRVVSRYVNYSADAQFFNVSITVQYGLPVPTEAYTASPYGLVCTATSNTASITWVTLPPGVTGLQPTSGGDGTSTLAFNPVLPSYAGLYVCNASANGVTRTTSYAFNLTLNARTLHCDVGRDLDIS